MSLRCAEDGSYGPYLITESTDIVDIPACSFFLAKLNPELEPLELTKFTTSTYLINMIEQIEHPSPSNINVQPKDIIPKLYFCSSSVIGF